MNRSNELIKQARNVLRVVLAVGAGAMGTVELAACGSEGTATGATERSVATVPAPNNSGETSNHAQQAPKAPTTETSTATSHRGASTNTSEHSSTNVDKIIASGYHDNFVSGDGTVEDAAITRAVADAPMVGLSGLTAEDFRAAFESGNEEIVRLMPDGTTVKIKNGATPPEVPAGTVLNFGPSSLYPDAR